MKQEKRGFFISLIITLAVLSYIRYMWLNDVIFDDNCWILSYYATHNLDEFLRTGFYELRRVPLGVFTYYYFSIHKLTDHAYAIWNSLNLAVQILSPVFLYLFINNLSGRNRFLAFLTASVFIVCLADNTLPYYLSIVYRLGTLLCIISFYLTERALIKETRRGMLLSALTLSAFSSYVLMETTVALEPARLLLIGYMMSGKDLSRNKYLKKTFMLWLPFIIVLVPLLMFKLTHKPYGIYNSTYPIDPYFFLNFELHARAIRHFRFNNWSYLYYLSGVANIWSVISGISSVFIVIITMVKGGISECGASFRELSRINGCDSLRGRTGNLFLLGLMLFVPVLCMYELAGRVPAPGMEGRHATVLLFGYSIMLGCLFYFFFKGVFINSLRPLGIALLALFIGAGVFLNNVNLDVYLKGQGHQKSFWKVFTARFPGLPEQASFFMDVRGDDRFEYYADLESNYELELPLNLLYARKTGPGEFRNYKVYALSEGISDDWKKSGDILFPRQSHWGCDTFDSKQLIIIRYRDGELLVNREILGKYPEVPYRMWLDKDPPEFTGEIPEYPLRYKLKGFFTD